MCAKYRTLPARFVIADLTSVKESDSKTGVRGGVYFEAGYAKGLGLEVIFTCRENTTERVHFDLKQINTIMWYENDKKIYVEGNNDFCHVLKERIIATVGKGPFFDKA